MQQQLVLPHNTPYYSRQNTLPIFNRPTLKHVVFLRRHEKRFFFWDTKLWQGVFVTRIVMRESQFEKLCGLRQTAVSWAIYSVNCCWCVAVFYPVSMYVEKRSGKILVHVTGLNVIIEMKKPAYIIKRCAACRRYMWKVRNKTQVF
jgi:hypothetical protein